MCNFKFNRFVDNQSFFVVFLKLLSEFSNTFPCKYLNYHVLFHMWRNHHIFRSTRFQENRFHRNRFLCFRQIIHQIIESSKILSVARSQVLIYLKEFKYLTTYHLEMQIIDMFIHI